MKSICLTVERMTTGRGALALISDKKSKYRSFCRRHLNSWEGCLWGMFNLLLASCSTPWAVEVQSPTPSTIIYFHDAMTTAVPLEFSGGSTRGSDKPHHTANVHVTSVSSSVLCPMRPRGPTMTHMYLTGSNTSTPLPCTLYMAISVNGTMRFQTFMQAGSLLPFPSYRPHFRSLGRVYLEIF